MQKKLSLIIKKVKQDKDFNSIQAIIFYGSRNKENYRRSSDIDICLITELDKRSRFNLRKRILGSVSNLYDIQTFNDLPLVIKKEVLEGKILYCKDKDHLKELIIKIKKDFEDFYPRYLYYITHSKYEDVPKAYL
jgi:hypothetical protein